MTIDNQGISNLIKNQFPSFYQEDGPNFIAFVEAYYEWMEQTGNVIGDSRNLLSYRDVDTTLPEFLNHFTAKYLYGIPDKIKFDKRFLIKHVLDIYRAKGTIRGYKLLFKLLYDEDVQIYLPSRDIFTTSDGQWYQPQYLEVNTKDVTGSYVGQLVRGTTSGAEAVIDQFIQQPVGNMVKNILYLTDIQGQFVRGEKLVPQEVITTPNIMANAPTVVGSFTGLDIINGGQNFVVGDTLIITNGSGIEGEALITKTANGTGTLAFSILSGGNLYSMDADSIISRNVLGPNNTVVPRLSTNATPTGQGGSFNIGSLVNVQTITYNEDVILDTANNVWSAGIQNITVVTQGTGYTNTIANTITSTPLIFTNRWHLSDFNIIKTGLGYSNGDTVIVTGGTKQANGVVQTDGVGSLLAVDILNPGQWDTNGTATVTVTSATGNGANIAAILANTGSGVAGYIVTDNSTKVAQARVSAPGSGYIVPPIVTVGNTSGTGATFSANVFYTYNANNVNFPNAKTPIDLYFTYSTKQFGTIASLTNISTGNNYSTNPDVTVIDNMLSKPRPGNVYFSNTSIGITGIGTKFASEFHVGDVIMLQLTNNVDANANSFYDYRIIRSIANDTFMQVDDNPIYTANGNLYSAYVTKSGSGYKNTDTISVTGGSGSGANLSFTTDSGGSIITLSMRNPGSGYLTAPTISITSNTGSGATFYSTVTTSAYYLAVSPILANFLPKYDIPGFTTFAENDVPGDNADINATPVFGTGIIKEIRVKNSGIGYQDGEYVNLATYGALTDFTVVSGGSGYANGQSLVFSGGSPVTTAQAKIETYSNGSISGVSVQYYGSGYKFVPDIRVISTKGTGGVITCNIGGLNTKYNLSGNIKLGGVGSLKGQWTGTKSFLSSNKYLQDSYYYQPFSYEIQSSIPFGDYEKLVKKIYHVLGTEMFGRLIKTDFSETNKSDNYNSVTVN